MSEEFPVLLLVLSSFRALLKSWSIDAFSSTKLGMKSKSSKSIAIPVVGGQVRNSSRVQSLMFVPRVNGKEMCMRKLHMGTAILFLAATIPIAQARQSSDQQSAGDQVGLETR